MPKDMLRVWATRLVEMGSSANLQKMKEQSLLMNKKGSACNNRNTQIRQNMEPDVSVTSPSHD
ncbi:hypothetical protein KIN20_018760 [Parelaphostrongylus tenuis]|uniref:Uncharacterized protein n=1 Tax=Parelaphostrongylus tenuis TaxID=148309 RepID=A0AAD5N1H2_PARTN|nr:hypothetical protein KIN20_018760 [Parelaphostrongylus tenuis]